jgi:prepilin signal peptidase PulO-like enzyme (type II secretory pathway)
MVINRVGGNHLSTVADEPFTGVILRVIGFGCFTFVISVIDIRLYRIPDVCLVCLGSFLLFVDFFTAGKTIPWGLCTGAAAFLLFFVIYITTHGLGLGDVKYAGIIGYYLGFPRVLAGLLLASFTAVFIWCAGHFLFQWDRKTKLPFAPFMSMGALLASILPFGYVDFPGDYITGFVK